MNDLDRLRSAACQRTSNGLRRPARRRIAYTLTSNPFTVTPVSCHVLCRMSSLLHSVGFSPQVPVHWAFERHGDATAARRSATWAKVGGWLRCAADGVTRTLGTASVGDGIFSL